MKFKQQNIIAHGICSSLVAVELNPLVIGAHQGKITRNPTKPLCCGVWHEKEYAFYEVKETRLLVLPRCVLNRY